MESKEIKSVYKEINPEYSSERLILKLKLQYFGHLMQRADSLEKTDAGEDWGQGEKATTEDEMVGWHHWLNRHEFGRALGVRDGQKALCAEVYGVARSQTQLSDWMELICPDHNYTLVSDLRSLRERLDWRSTRRIMVILQGYYLKISYVSFIQGSGFGNFPHPWWLDWVVVCLFVLLFVVFVFSLNWIRFNSDLCSPNLYYTWAAALLSPSF